MPQEQEQGQVLNPIEERILQFVKDNPGKSKSDVVRFLKDRHIAARIATLAHIDRLERNRMIICQLENPNSQIYKIYINKDNILSSVLIELEEFKEAFVNLLEKSKERINKKDYSVDAKELGLGIDETDPSKWSEANKVLYLELEGRRLDKIEDEYKELKRRLKSILSRLEGGKHKTNPQELKSLHDGALPIPMSVSDVKEFKNLYDDLIKNWYELSNCEVIWLTLLPVHLFFTLADIMLLRSTWVWSNSIRNKETLSLIYFNAFKKTSEIQIQLSEFSSNVKISVIRVPGSGYEEDIKKLFSRISRDPNDSLHGVDVYRILGMRSEIQMVINSLMKLSEEIKDFYYINPDIIFEVENIEELKKEATRLLKQAKLEPSNN